MKTGRPPRWILDLETVGPVVQEAVRVDERGRFTVPTRVRSHVAWLDTEKAREGLAILVEPGRMKVIASDAGEIVISRMKDLSDQSEGDAETTEEYRLVLETYERLRVDADGRTHLSPNALAHLWPSEAVQEFLYVLGYRNRLEIWSTSFRLRRREAGLEGLSGLPY